MTDRPQLLLIDDNEAYTDAIRAHMPEYELLAVSDDCWRAEDGYEAVAFLERNAAAVDLILLDMRFDLPAERLFDLPEVKTLRRQQRYQGVAILNVLKTKFPQLPIVVLTAMDDVSLGDINNQIESQSLVYMLEGDSLDALRIRIHQALSESDRSPEEGEILWGRNAGMRVIRRRLSVLAKGALPIVLEGETGTGKSHIAEHFLHNQSERPGPFIAIDLATIPKDLISSRLFGAVRGAFTGAVDQKGVFEFADKGTLFIDEVQNIPLDVQKLLLLVLQDQKVRPLGSNKVISVDVKVVVASNTSLAIAVQEGRFRKDLYMRLSPPTRVTIPSLRDRREDLRFMLTQKVYQAGSAPDIAPFREQFAAAVKLPIDAAIRLRFPDETTDYDDSVVQLILPGPAWRRLYRHKWPGNVRELTMVVHNLVTFTLVAAVEAARGGLPLRSNRLQIDAGLVNSLLVDETGVGTENAFPINEPDVFPVRLTPQKSLNAVTVSCERQYMEALFHQTDGKLEAMADRLLGDPTKSRKVRLRMNQLGLKLRELRRE
jgi:DNA-binding NtrC family response regulator